MTADERAEVEELRASLAAARKALETVAGERDWINELYWRAEKELVALRERVKELEAQVSEPKRGWWTLKWPPR